ncbi:MmcQ/YjbR family DNA-binding protein [Nonomuraea sp. NPDC049400]|uniref:MmcQ/YjbR family DNA-binding protein n=1 Tax=Nonomuraea sp. NPDC049400 TaxID=3364352 RepID=UPI0037B1EED1
MNGPTLHKTAADCAQELPGAHLDHPFGDDWEVFKALALRKHNSHITPGYHMNKKHWITLEGGEGVDKSLVRELVTESYRLVVAHLPKAEQPVDPHTCGSGARAAR